MCVCLPSNSKPLFSTFWSCHNLLFYYLCCYNLFTNFNSLIDDSNGKGCIDVPLLNETQIDFTDPIQLDVLYIEVCQYHIKVDKFY